jgi:hypothetical protein
MDPYSLRYLQGSRARYGHVLRHQVAFRSREEGEEARVATRGWQGRRSLRSIGSGLGARHLFPCQEARFGLALSMMAKNSRPIYLTYCYRWLHTRNVAAELRIFLSVL